VASPCCRRPAGPTRYMRGSGVEVDEVDRHDRRARRRTGTSDPADASAGRVVGHAVWSAGRPTVPTMVAKGPRKRGAYSRRGRPACITVAAESQIIPVSHEVTWRTAR
jgi:hypothetical protein